MRRLAAFALALLSAPWIAGCPTPPPPDPDPNPAVRRFEARLNYPANVRPFAVAVADFNGDGRPDVATANDSSNDVSVLIANASGGFALHVDYPVGDSPVGIAAADLDGDGAIDLVTANLVGDSLSVLYGAGAGAFDDAVAIALGAGTRPQAVAAGDFNGDTRPDLAVPYGTGGIGTLAVLLALPGGGFGAPSLIPVGGGPRFVVAAQLAGGTALDLVTANRDGNDCSLLAGNGDGTFAAAVPLPAGAAPRMVQAVDLDGGGALDLVVSNPAARRITVLLNDGAGAFVPAAGAEDLPGLPSRFAVGDFDGDAAPDLAAVLFGGDPPDGLGRIAVLQGDGLGGFGEAREFGVGPLAADVVAADMNGDSDLDLVAANTGVRQISLIFGRGDGSFQSDERLPIGAGPRMTAAADFNADSRADIVVLNQGSSDLSLLLNSASGLLPARRIPLSSAPRGLDIADINEDNRPDIVVTLINTDQAAVLLGSGGGNFQPERRFGVRGPDQPRSADPRSVAAGDVDRDGNLDLVTANSNNDTLSFLKGDGAGTFGAPVEFATRPPSNFPLDAQLADLDGDANLDVVFLSADDPNDENDNSPGRVVRLLGNGDGSFDPDSSLRVASGDLPRGLTIGDLDRDGDIDAVTVHPDEDNVYVLAGTPDGRFSAGQARRSGVRANTAVIVELSGDALPDLLLTGETDAVAVLVNRGGLNFNEPEIVALGDSPIAAIAPDLDGDGARDLVVPNRDSQDLSVVFGVR